MLAQITDKIRGYLVVPGNGENLTTSRKRKIQSFEEESGQSPAKRQKSNVECGTEVHSRGALVDWITRTKTSFQESYYFRKLVDTPKKLVDKFKAPSYNPNLAEPNQQFHQYLPPLSQQQQQQQQQHISFMQPAYNQTNPYRNQGMENKDTSHQVHSTPRSKYPQGYSFSKARHDVENFQFAKSKENFAFKAPTPKPQQTPNRYPPNASVLPNRSNDHRSISHRSVYEKVFIRSGQSKHSMMEQIKRKGKLAARESIRLDEKSRYAELIQQFTTRIPGTAFGSSQIRQPSASFGRSVFGSTILGSTIHQPSRLASRQKSTGSKSSEYDSDSSMSVPKVQVQPRKSLHDHSIIDLTEKSYLEIQSARKIREHLSKRSQPLRTSQERVEELQPDSLPSTPAATSHKLPQPDFYSGEPEIIKVITPPELPPSPAQELLQQKLDECKYAEEDWISNLREKFSADKRKKEREIVEETIKCQFHKEKRDELEEKLEESLRKKLALAEKEPPVLEETFEEEGEEIDEEAQFPPLTNEQEDKVDNALVPHPSGQVLSDGFRLQITRKDIATLAGLNWLNDEIINFYMNLLMERGNQENFPSVHAFNTFFFPKIIGSGHSGVKRWTRKIDVFSMDYLLVPVHLGMHWCLSVVDFPKKEIRYYDSMGGNNNQCLNSLKQYLQDESLDKKKQPYDTSSWKLINVKDIPQQMNGSDCGMFACKFAEYISRGAPITFTQEQMPYFRRRMVLEILTQQLL